MSYSNFGKHRSGRGLKAFVAVVCILLVVAVVASVLVLWRSTNHFTELPDFDTPNEDDFFISDPEVDDSYVYDFVDPFNYDLNALSLSYESFSSEDLETLSDSSYDFETYSSIGIKSYVVSVLADFDLSDIVSYSWSVEGSIGSYDAYGISFSGSSYPQNYVTVLSLGSSSCLLNFIDYFPNSLYLVYTCVTSDGSEYMAYCVLDCYWRVSSFEFYFYIGDFSESLPYLPSSDGGVSGDLSQVENDNFVMNYVTLSDLIFFNFDSDYSAAECYDFASGSYVSSRFGYASSGFSVNFASLYSFLDLSSVTRSYDDISELLFAGSGYSLAYLSGDCFFNFSDLFGSSFDLASSIAYMNFCNFFFGTCYSDLGILLGFWPLSYHQGSYLDSASASLMSFLNESHCKLSNSLSSEFFDCDEEYDISTIQIEHNFPLYSIWPTAYSSVYADPSTMDSNCNYFFFHVSELVSFFEYSPFSLFGCDPYFDFSSSSINCYVENLSSDFNGYSNYFRGNNWIDYLKFSFDDILGNGFCFDLSLGISFEGFFENGIFVL